MKNRSISLMVFSVGIIYMVLDGWLLSWWYVPAIAGAGPSFISDTSYYTSRAFFTFWALSVPLGSLISAFGLILYARMERGRILIFIICSLGLLAWLGFWSQTILYPALYGIGGGMILISFCVAVWSLAATRRNSNSNTKNVLDLRAAGFVFLVIAAWGMCGLLGVPSFGLRPEQIFEFGTKGTLLTMGAKVLVCFALGWIFLALSQYHEYRLNKKAVLQAEPGLNTESVVASH